MQNLHTGKAIERKDTTPNQRTNEGKKTEQPATKKKKEIWMTTEANARTVIIVIKDDVRLDNELPKRYKLLLLKHTKVRKRETITKRKTSFAIISFMFPEV